MRIRGTVQIPAQTVYRHLLSIKCDLCGAMCTSENGHEPRWPTDKQHADWTFWQAPQVEVSLTHYSQHADVDADRHAYDLCPTCFTEKLEPWLQAQGAKPGDDY